MGSLRASLSTRRSNLDQAKYILHAECSTSSSTNINAQIKSQIRTVSSGALSTETALAATRKVLIRSLVEAFDLREAAVSEPPSRGSRSAHRMAASSASYIAGAGMALFGRASMLTGSVADVSNRLGAVVTKSEWSIAGLVLPVSGDLRSESTPFCHYSSAPNHIVQDIPRNISQLLSPTRCTSSTFSLSTSGSSCLLKSFGLEERLVWATRP